MFVQQTVMSAAIIVVLGGSAVADPGGDGRGYFQIGAGYATDDGFIATAAIDQPSLFHSGIELGESAWLSQRRQRFDLTLDVPGLAGFDLYSERRVLPGFTRKATGLAMRHTMQLSPHVTAWVGYRLEQVDIERDAIERATTLHPPDSAGLVSALSAGIKYSTVDPLHRHGSELGLWADYADPRLGSTYEIGRVGGWAATHQPVGPFTLHLGGSFTALASPTGVPLSERLFLDGASDVRGYAPGAFGPVGGGTQKLAGHASLELPVGHGLSLEGFVDYARISNMEITSPIGIAHGSGMSAGYGVIWRSPLGPLHVDIAYPECGAPTWFISFGP